MGHAANMPKKKKTGPVGGGHGRSISKKDYKILKQVFIRYDKDNSGTVTYAEFLKALEADPTGNSLTKSAAGMFDQMDEDQSGEMEFRELLMSYYPLCTKEEIDKFIHKYDPPPKKVEIAQKELTSEQEEELEGLMKIMDEDGDADGRISCEELKKYAENVGIDEDTIELWFKKYDKNGDGELDEGEFKEFFQEVWNA